MYLERIFKGTKYPLIMGFFAILRYQKVLLILEIIL